MKSFSKIKFYYIIIIIYIYTIKQSYSLINEAEINKYNSIFKVAVVLTGKKNDIADNFLLVQGIQDSAKLLNILDSTFVEDIQLSNLNETTFNLIQKNFSLIVFSNYIYYNYSYSISKQFNNVSFIIINNDLNSLINNNNQFNNENNNSNIVELYYPTSYTSFLGGYASGLGTTTNTIGYLTKGEEFGDTPLLNMFYFGARLANPNIKVLYYSLGENATQEIVSSSIRFLLNEMKVDSVCGTSIYEKMILKHMVDNDYLVLSQTNGYPNLNNNNVVFNVMKDWSISLSPIISNMIEVFKSNKNSNSSFISNSLQLLNSNDSDSSLSSPSFSFSSSSSTDSAFYFNFNFSFFKFDYSPSIYSFSTIKTNINKSLDLFQKDFIKPYLYKYNILKDNDDNNNDKIVLNSMVLDINQCEDIMKYEGECIQVLQFKNQDYKNLEYLGNYNSVYGVIQDSISIKLGFIIVSAILIGMLIFIQICIYKFKNKPSFKSASPTFLVFITIGGMMSYLGIIIWVSSNSSFSCNFRLWLISIGFSMMIGAIVVKNFRIWVIFDSKELYKIKITNFQLLPWVLGMILLNIFILCLISFLGDIHVSKDFVDPFNYRLSCTMDSKANVSLFILLGYFCFILLIGVFVSWKIRIVDIQEFNESKTIAHTLYSISFCLLIIIPLLISQQSNEHVNLILCVAGVFLVSAIIFNMFIPKFYGLFVYGAEGTNEIFRSTKVPKQDNGGKKNNNRRVNLVLYDFTDDSSSDVNSKEMEEFNQNTEKDIITQPNSEVANEITNYDDTIFDASEQPNTQTPRTNITTPRSNDILTPRTFVSNTPRTDLLITPRTDLLITPRTEISIEESEMMTPRQYHNHLITLSPISEEGSIKKEENENEEQQIESNEITQTHMQININEISNNNDINK